MAAADRLIERTDEAIRFVETERFNEARGLGILREICAAGSTELPDFETARQFGWTALIVYDELPQNRHNRQIDKALAAINAELSLTLPSREEELSQKSAIGSDECVCVANKSVPQTLATAARYDPLEFQKHCKKLAELLGAAQK